MMNQLAYQDALAQRKESRESAMTKQLGTNLGSSLEGIDDPELKKFIGAMSTMLKTGPTSDMATRVIEPLMRAHEATQARKANVAAQLGYREEALAQRGELATSQQIGTERQHREQTRLEQEKIDIKKEAKTKNTTELQLKKLHAQFNTRVSGIAAKLKAKPGSRGGYSTDPEDARKQLSADINDVNKSVSGAYNELSPEHTDQLPYLYPDVVEGSFTHKMGHVLLGSPNEITLGQTSDLTAADQIHQVFSRIPTAPPAGAGATGNIPAPATTKPTVDYSHLWGVKKP
jgi:hypothetical protein